MCIGHGRQPFKRLVVRPQREMSFVQVLPEMQNPPNQCITLSFHGVESSLYLGQGLAGISNDSLEFSLLLGQDEVINEDF